MLRFDERVIAGNGMLTSFDLMSFLAVGHLGSPVKSGSWA
jgi:hypothetical protein